MKNTIKSYLGFKLFLLLTGVIVLSVILTTYTALKAISSYGHEVADLNEQHIRHQAFSYLREVTRERAGRYQASFARIAASAGMLGSQASTIYSNLTYYSDSPLEDYRYHVNTDNRFWRNSMEDPVVSLYWGSADMSLDIKSELLALTHMTPLFQRVLVDNPEVLASHSISVSGIGQYCTNNLKGRQVALDLPPVSLFDLREGEPMTIFTESEDSSRKVRWTNIYKDDVIDGLMLTASAPIYDTTGTFRGITGIDVPLDNVIDDILQSGKEQSTGDVILFSFLLDRDGKLIAFPERYFELLGISPDNLPMINSGDTFDVNIINSQKKDVRELAHQVLGKEEFLGELYDESGVYYVVTRKMSELDWVFGVVVLENNLLASVQESRLSLKNTVKSIQMRGIDFALLFVCIAVAIAFIAVRYLVLPLRTLMSATERVAAGDFSVKCPVTTTDEIGILATSFNTMVAQLQIAQGQQARYAESLELEVEQRNTEIGVQDRQLQKSLDEKEVLLKEIYHRTKNNMLVIISLLDLQIQDIEDEQAKAVFLETESRIRAMALVHEKLYQSQNLSEIDLGSYLSDIVESLLITVGTGDRIKFQMDAESIEINIDYAIPLGLVVNEIVTNTVKHAFPDNRSGLIYLRIKKDQDGEIVLTVGDDGVGLPSEIDLQNSTSFGIQVIVKSLVEMQLKGTVTILRDGGTSFLINIPEPKTKKRI